MAKAPDNSLGAMTFPLALKRRIGVMPKKRDGEIIGNLPGERLVRMRELRVLTGLGRSTIHRLIGQGRFPKQLHPFGNNLAAWRYSEVAQWIADRCEGKAA
jgi:prophage regulatory protein